MSKINKFSSNLNWINAVVNFWLMLGPLYIHWLCDKQFFSYFSAKLDMKTIRTFEVSLSSLKTQECGKKLHVGFSSMNSSRFGTFSIMSIDSRSLTFSSTIVNLPNFFNFLKLESKIFREILKFLARRCLTFVFHKSGKMILPSSVLPYFSNKKFTKFKFNSDISPEILISLSK